MAYLNARTFGADIRVECPNCQGQARLTADARVLCNRCPPIVIDDDRLSLKTRCEACGLQADLHPMATARCRRCRAVIYGRGRKRWPDPAGSSVQAGPNGQRLKIWAETSTRHGVVWALNPAHLSAMRTYLTGKRFTPTRLPNSDWRSRLPKWMKLARNRAEVLRAFRRLERQFTAID